MGHKEKLISIKDKYVLFQIYKKLILKKLNHTFKTLYTWTEKTYKENYFKSNLKYLKWI